MKMTESNVRKIVREELLRMMEQEEPKAPSLDDLEFVSKERVAYETWAAQHGHPSAEVQSVLADYIVDQKLHNAHDLHKKLCKELGFDHDSLMAAVENRLPTETESEPEESARQLDLAQVMEQLLKL